MKYIFNTTLKSISSELIFALYFWGFIILRPFLQLAGSFSFVVLLLNALLLIFVPILFYRRAYINRNVFFVILSFILILLFDYIFRYNTFIVQYFKSFIIYGIIPMYLLSQVNNYKLLLNYFSKMSLVLMLAYCWVPFCGYMFFADYMDYGFNLVLPALLGISVGRVVFKRKWLIFELLAIVDAAFTSRSVVLSILLFYLILFYFSDISLLKKKVLTVFVLLFCGSLFQFRSQIMTYIYESMLAHDLYSYTIHRFYLLAITDSLQDALASRSGLWEGSMSMIQDWRCLVFGNGTSSYYRLIDNYPHNIFLDIVVQYGLIGLVFLSSFVINSLVKVLSSKFGYYKMVGVILFCLWFPKMLFSLYIFKEVSFWCFIAYGLVSREKKND